MKESLGIIEIIGLTTAVFVADTMSKTANIDVVDIENTKGLGYMTIKITGNVAAVKTAISAGEMIAKSHGKFVSSIVIARPSENTEKSFINLFEEKKEIEELVEEKVEAVEEFIEAEKTEENFELEESKKESSEEKILKIQEKKILKKKTQKNVKKRKEAK